MRVLDQWSSWPTAKPPGAVPPDGAPPHVLTFYLVKDEGREHPSLLVEITGRGGALASVDEFLIPEEYTSLADFLRRSAARVENWRMEQEVNEGGNLKVV